MRMQLSVNIHVDHHVEPHMFKNNALIDCQSIHIMCPKFLDVMEWFSNRCGYAEHVDINYYSQQYLSQLISACGRATSDGALRCAMGRAAIANSLSYLPPSLCTSRYRSGRCFQVRSPAATVKIQAPRRTVCALQASKERTRACHTSHG